MNIILTVVALIVVGIGIVVNKTDKINSWHQADLKDQVLSSEIEEPEDVQPSSSEEVTALPTPTIQIVVPTSTPIPIVTSQASISDYHYPNSQLVSSSENSLMLSSSEDPETITNWYKEKIKSEGMNVKTFVSTKTNNNVLNKLVGSNGKKEVSVEIKKPVGESVTSITINIKYN